MALTLLQRTVILQRTGSFLKPFGWNTVTYDLSSDRTNIRKFKEPTSPNILNSTGVGSLELTNIDILEGGDMQQYMAAPTDKATGGQLIML